MTDAPLVDVHFVQLHDPVMILALDGWIGAGLEAANAMSVLQALQGPTPSPSSTPTDCSTTGPAVR